MASKPADSTASRIRSGERPSYGVSDSDMGAKCSSASGWMSGCSRTPDVYLVSTGSEEHTSQLIRGGAGGQHIIDDGDTLTTEAVLAVEGTAHVIGSRRRVHAGLNSGVSSTACRGAIESDPQVASHGDGNKCGLIVSTLTQAPGG